MYHDNDLKGEKMPLYYAISVWLLMFASAKPNTIINNKHTSRFILLLLFGLTTLLIASNLNDFLWGTGTISDLVIYAREFNAYKTLSYSQSLIHGGKEPLFTLFSWVLAKLLSDVRIYILIAWLLINSIVIKSLQNIFEPRTVTLVFFTYINFPFFITYILNGMRQGFAMALLLFALSLLVKPNSSRVLFYGTIVAAIGFHIVAAPFSAILIIQRLSKKQSIKKALTLWTISSVLFLTGMNSGLLAPIVAQFDPISQYLEQNTLSRYAGVNRPDFLLFSLFFVVLGLFIYSKTTSEKKDKYKIILNSYILFNTVFLLLGFIAFSNRLSAFSWFLIPVLIWYPVQNAENRKYNLLISILIVIISLVIGTFTTIPDFLF